jgi:hypothetical protein
MTTRTNTATRKNGGKKVKRLHQEALKKVEEGAGEIATALLQSAKAGHVLSTRLLVELAEGDAEVEEAQKRRPLLTLLARLEAEPKLPADAPIEPWDDEDDAEETVEGKALVKD